MRDDDDGCDISPILVDKLRSIVKNTECEIVLSSTWRLGSDWIGTLGKHGYPLDELPIISRTPRFPGEYRGLEIESWLEEQLNFQPLFWDRDKLIGNCQSAGLFNYLILDDDSDMLFNQHYNFICTPHELGITDQVVSHAIERLNTPYWDLPYIDDWRKYR